MIAMKKLERVAPEGKFLLLHKNHKEYISGAVHGAAGASAAFGRAALPVMLRPKAAGARNVE